jgi:hypothetical protein
MNQTPFEQDMVLNRQAWEELRDQIRREHAGKYVAIAQGRLIAATATFQEAKAAIQRLQPTPECYIICEADDEPSFEVINDYWEQP